MRMTTLPNVAPLAGLALRCQADARLVTLSREGQPRAFEEIVRRYRGPLVSFAAAIVPAHRAEDVVQEALAKAHSALLSSDAEIQLRPWLYTIVRNRALNDLRDEHTHEHLDESFDGVPQPPEVAARRQELETLIARVKGLPPAQREALVQRELGGRSHEEIAAALGATPGAVRGLIFRARTALRDAAGMLVPMPALRALLDAGPLRAEAASTGIGGAAVGLTAGGGGEIAIKAGTTLAIAVLTLGSGIALNGPAGKGQSNSGPGSHGDTGRTDHGGASYLVADHRSPTSERAAGGSGPGDGGSRSDDDSDRGSSGPGSSGDEAVGGGDSSGESGGGGSGDDGHSGSEAGGGHQGSGGTVGGEHEGPSDGSGSDDSGSSGSGDSGSSGDDGETSGDGGTSAEGSGEPDGPHKGSGDVLPDPATSPTTEVAAA